LRHIEVSPHSAVGVHDDRRQSETERNPRDRTYNSRSQRIGRVVNDDAPILESQGFERADLRFFLDGYTVHRRNHGQNGDKQKQHG